MMFSDSMLCASSSLTPSFKNLGALFNGGATDGLMVDLTDTTTLFQDANGAAAVVNNGDPVGFALDQHKWSGKTLSEYRAVQPELQTNGGFDSGITGWSATSGGSASWDAGNQALLSTASGSGLVIVPGPAVSTVPGRWYEVTVENSLPASGARGFYIGTSSGGSQLLNAASFVGAGTWRRFFKATGATTYISAVGAGGAGVVSRFNIISVKEIDGHHATQTSTARPVWNSATNDVLFDGSNDCLLSPFRFGNNQANVLLAAYGGPFGSTGSTRFMSGTYDGVEIVYVAQAQATGAAIGRVTDTSTLTGTTILTGGTHAVHVEKSGSTKTELIVNGVVEVTYNGNAGNPQAGADLAIGSGMNSSGSPVSFMQGNLKRVIAARVRSQDTMTAADFHENLIN